MITKGKILHTLTARSVIRDWDTGVLSAEKSDHKLVKRDRKQDVIQLSIEYQIVTQFTSFVAIEHREKGEDPSRLLALKITDLLVNESVDQLGYMGWEDKEKAKDVAELSPVQEIEEIMKVVAFESVQSAELRFALTLFFVFLHIFLFLFFY
jgi:hypothetical protein